jgi:capsular exopolysaccharide synthesis family protein
VTLLDFVRLTRANVKLIFVCFSLGLLAAFLWTMTRPVVYASTSIAQVNVGANNDVSSMAAAMGLSAKLADQYSAFVGSSQVATIVTKEYGIPPGLVRLSGAADELTSSVLVTGYAATPEDASALSDAGVAATIQFANDDAASSLPQGSSQATLVRMTKVSPAGLPLSPYSPNYTPNLMAGGFLGIILGYVAALVRINLDRKLRNVDEVEELIDTPVLAIVPDVKDLDRKQTDGGFEKTFRGPHAEAFRQLRTNFRFIDVDNPIRTVVITSANEGEGKSTVAANLARVLASAGQDTILVDADLRRPVVAGVFGVDAQVGLAQVLVGDVTAEEALQETGIEHLQVMSAGRVPHNPSELLGSHRMQLLLAELAEGHLVVLDAPPLLPVTDAALLAGISDGAMVVFAIGQTYKEQAKLAKRRLAQTGGRMLGVVLNRAPLRGLGAVVYGYGYGSYTTSYGDENASSGASARPGARKKAAAAHSGTRTK